MKNIKIQLLTRSIPVLLLLPFASQGQGIEITSGGRIAATGAASIEISNGNFINNGTYTKGTETVIFSGNTAKTISGTALSDFNNLTIANSGGISIAENSKVTVSGTLSVTSSLILNSTSSGTASLIHSTIGVTATVQRYMTGGWSAWNTGWHQISSPVVSQAISAFTTTGSGNDYDFYGWDEPTNYWKNYKDAGFSVWNGGTNFNVGQGYMISYEQTQSGKSFSGSLNVVNVTKANLSQTGTQSYTGWHLLGNPFASAIKWNDGNWALTAVAGSAKIWHETNKSYSDIAANGFIPASQGFMVQVNNGINSITIPAISREHNATPWYKSETELQRFFLVASETEVNSAQECQVVINPQASESFDFDYDSRFLAGYAPQFYSMAGDEMLSTNAYPSLSSANVIHFGFAKNAANSFSIELKESIEGYTVYLTDKKTGIVADLSDIPVYNFTSSEGDDVNRFLLHFSPLLGIGDTEMESNFSIYATDGQIKITSLAQLGGKVNVTDMTGRIIASGRVEAGATTFIDMQGHSGVYIVSVLTSKGISNTNIVVK